MSKQVWPEGEVSPSFVKDLERLFPQVIVLFNEFWGVWQAFEIDEGSAWTAERLRNAIVAAHSSKDVAWEWWKHPAAPRIFEDLLMMVPGDWFIQYLREKDHWRTGGADRFVNEVEERERQKELSKSKDRHDYHRGLADDVRKRAAEALPSGMSRTDALKQIRRNEGGAEIVY